MIMARAKKEKVKKRKAIKSENRVFKKLSQTFASKLDVQEDSSSVATAAAVATASQNPRAVFHKNVVVSSRFRRKETKKVDVRITGITKAKVDHDEFDLEYAGLVEREQAAAAMMQRRKAARGGARKQQKRRRHKNIDSHHGLTHSKDAVKTPVAAPGQLDFQPPTFSLTKSTNQLLTEATARLHNVGLYNTSISTTPSSSVRVLPYSQFPLQQQSEWYSNNPNHHRLQVVPTKNRFSTLTPDHDDDDADSLTSEEKQLPSLSFQPATFALIPTRNDTFQKEAEQDDVDPDL